MSAGGGPAPAYADCHAAYVYAAAVHDWHQTGSALDDDTPYYDSQPAGDASHDDNHHSQDYSDPARRFGEWENAAGGAGHVDGVDGFGRVGYVEADATVGLVGESGRWRRGDGGEMDRCPL